MMMNEVIPSIDRDARQRARLSLRVGRRARLTVRVDVTADGLLAIGALVSSILLSTAVLVGVATRASKSEQLPN
jgi:hypothetical protein